MLVMQVHSISIRKERTQDCIIYMHNLSG